MQSTFFDHDPDFSMAFDKFKRALPLFAISLLVFSYLHHFEMHAKAHDKLLRALTASELTSDDSHFEREGVTDAPCGLVE